MMPYISKQGAKALLSVEQAAAVNRMRKPYGSEIAFARCRECSAPDHGRSRAGEPPTQ